MKKKSPVEKQKLVDKKSVKAVPLQASTLNQVEPAAKQIITEVSQPDSKMITEVFVPQVIPVVSERDLKGRRIKPKYPERALRMRQEGVVWLHVLISETGRQKDIKIHRPTQYALLNRAALKAVKKWTFTPNVINGKATSSWVEIPVEFKIN